MQVPVAIGGFGSVGKALARRLLAGVPGFELVAIGSRDPARTSIEVERVLGRSLLVVDSRAMAGCADILLECAPAHAFRGIVEPALQAGMVVVTISAAALLDNLDLREVAAVTNGRILLASGAIGGLDVVRAMSLGTISNTLMVTRKPPRSLAEASWIVDRKIDLSGLTAPLRVFAGSARDAARLFPANANVAAAISLAGAGPDRTLVEIWADPTVDRNTHTLHMESDAARIALTVANAPSVDNPATSRIAALSMLATLINLKNPISIGS